MHRTVIECTNCGGGGFDPQFWVTLGALLIAAGALAINVLQFRQLMRSESAHASFTLVSELVGADPDGVLRTPEDSCEVRFKVKIRNVGSRAASETLVNVHMPSWVRRPGWCNSSGNQDKDPPPGSRVSYGVSDRRLIDSAGKEHEAVAIAADLPRFSLNRWIVFYFNFEVHVPDEGVLEIPLVISASANETRSAEISSQNQVAYVARR